MVPSKVLACTFCAAVLVFAAGCADGTGKALTPTLPSVDASTNPDGTRLKATSPQPRSPISATRVTSLTPQLRLQTGAATHDPGAELTYEIEVLEGDTVVARTDEPVVAGQGETTWTVPDKMLKTNKTYTWRARALFAGVPGSWSDNVTFRTPLPPPTDGPVFCAGSSGLDIVKCVAAAYPEKLVSTAAGDGSDERRAANMEFLRDRIIETGICKGMSLGRNYKRGTPVISKDFIVLRSGGRDKGVDIARAYDDVKSRLQLSWQVFDERPYGYPYWAGYPSVDCSGVQ